MLTLDHLTDPIFDKQKKYSSADRFFLRFIRDERDLPFIYLTIKISLTILTLGVILFLPFINGWLFAVLSVIYLVLNNIIFKGPFGLMLHCTSHRKWFRKEYDFMNYYLPWVVGPFFGQTPETYFSHHLGMHHPENNLPEDRSSTMFYQRNSFRDFLIYLGDFIFLGLVKLSAYFIKKRRKSLLRKTLIGEFSFILLCVALMFVSWEATLVVFIIPFIVSRVIMMTGNFAQHAFVDALEPENAYKNSITCINTKYNHKCWNDGYHISHHVRPAMHWTEHPKHFIKHQQKYAENKAVVFEGIEFLGVFYYVMTKNYRKLAGHFVDIGNNFKSEEEIIEHLKYLNQKIESYPAVDKAMAS